jgi:RNA polymerase sigma-70 factor (ECF subfamily)
MVAYGLQTDEAELITAAKAGDQEAFRQIVERYQGAVYNLAYRMLGTPEEAEDAAQEIFVRIYRQLGRYDPTRKFSTWTLAIATNYCIDQLRRRRMQLVPLENIIPWARDREAGPEAEALGQESRDEVQRLIKELPEKYRAPLVLRYWEDLSCAERGRGTAGCVVASVSCCSGPLSTANCHWRSVGKSPRTWKAARSAAGRMNNYAPSPFRSGNCRWRPRQPISAPA